MSSAAIPPVLRSAFLEMTPVTLTTRSALAVEEALVTKKPKAVSCHRDPAELPSSTDGISTGH